MKDKNMTLEELGKEYEKHILLQDHFIRKCKEEIGRAKKLGDSDAVMELNAKLQKFRQIKGELRETANHLKNYYKGEH